MVQLLPSRNIYNQIKIVPYWVFSLDRVCIGNSGSLLCNLSTLTITSVGISDSDRKAFLPVNTSGAKSGSGINLTT